ncbi:hypothetical protein Dimus_016595 [Dionaea muscipula]
MDTDVLSFKEKFLNIRPLPFQLIECEGRILILTFQDTGARERALMEEEALRQSNLAQIGKLWGEVLPGSHVLNMMAMAFGWIKVHTSALQPISQDVRLRYNGVSSWVHVTEESVLHPEQWVVGFSGELQNNTVSGGRVPQGAADHGLTSQRSYVSDSHLSSGSKATTWISEAAGSLGAAGFGSKGMETCVDLRTDDGDDADNISNLCTKNNMSHAIVPFAPNLRLTPDRCHLVVDLGRAFGPIPMIQESAISASAREGQLGMGLNTETLGLASLDSNLLGLLGVSYPIKLSFPRLFSIASNQGASLADYLYNSSRGDGDELPISRQFEFRYPLRAWQEELLNDLLVQLQTCAVHSLHGNLVKHCTAESKVSMLVGMATESEDMFFPSSSWDPQFQCHFDVRNKLRFEGILPDWECISELIFFTLASSFKFSKEGMPFTINCIIHHLRDLLDGGKVELICSSSRDGYRLEMVIIWFFSFCSGIVHHVGLVALPTISDSWVFMFAPATLLLDWFMSGPSVDLGIHVCSCSLASVGLVAFGMLQ